ncbi:hypothetical protein Sjap_000242 [Stephania japonica]|uniref:mannan endo-1,4-beta-mannosidase n=1 Tax=Stephania japonica TaxID=461633 RepID=A0AAP0KK20_9MAGN
MCGRTWVNLDNRDRIRVRNGEGVGEATGGMPMSWISPKSPGKLDVNPGEWASVLGTDFIQNSKSSNIDFASVHIYPDQWLVGQPLETKLKFVEKWVVSHIDDGDKVLKKPVMFTEFGLSNMNKDFELSQRDKLYKRIFDNVYRSAKKNGAGAGTFIWQFMVGGMEEYNDDFGIVPWERPTTYRLITEQSCKLALIHRRDQLTRFERELCEKI